MTTGALAVAPEIHIRVLSLSIAAELLAGLHALLSEDERARCQRFRFARDRRRYIVARAGLRRVLAAETGTPPSKLVFSYGAQGKPALPRGPSFNLSHAGELAAIAVTRDVAVGVDIEPLEQAIGVDDITPILTPDEARWLRRDPSWRGARLLAYWVKKEAVGKAIGKGFAIPPIDLRAAIADEQVFLGPRESEGAGPWVIKPFRPAPGYVGAVAAPVRDLRVTLAAFDPLAD